MESKAVLGWTMTVSDWRHIIIAFKHHYCKGAIDAQMEEQVMSSLHALQSGHSVATETRIYGLNVESFAGVSQDMLQLYLGATSEYHRAFKIPLGGCGFSYVDCRMEHFDVLFPTAPNIHQDGTPDLVALCNLLRTVEASTRAQGAEILSKLDKLEKAVDKLQTAAWPADTTMVQPDIPPANPSPNHDITVTQPDIPPAASLADNDIRMDTTHINTMEPQRLPLAPLPRLPQVLPSAFQSRQGSQAQPPMPPLPPPAATVSALHHLKRLYGPTAVWSMPEQRKAVQALLALESDVFVVLRTGAGKTAIALLPAMMESTVTILVLPLLALIEDWRRRLLEHKIPFEQFKGAQSPDLVGNTNIVLVSSDMARGAPFKRALQVLAARREVVRFIIDEAHYYFTDLGFRDVAMKDPWNLRAYLPSQFVFMSATLAESARNYLAAQFLCKTVTTIASSSARPELTYLIAKGGKNLMQMIREAKELVKECKTALEWKAGDRYMVFVSTIAFGKDAASEMGLDFYRANSDAAPITDEERLAILGRFVSGQKEGLVCSSALGAGNDYPGVRLTIHIGTPGDITLFGQQSGRAGRDGRQAWCVVYPTGRAIPGDNDEVRKMRGVDQMNSLIDDGDKAPAWPQNCPRYVMSGHLDGEAKHCLALSHEYMLCNRCTNGTSFGC